MTQRGPDVQAMEGSTGSVTAPVAGAGKYTEGDDQTAPSHDTVTPAPESTSAAVPVVPPPAATQRVSERQAREVNPPPGGSVVRARVHPAAWGTVTGTVVGTTDGFVVVVVVDRVGATVGAGVRWWAAGVAEEDEAQPAAVAIRATRVSDATSRLGSTCPLTRARPARRI
jgi:hypothetical protein